MGVFVLFVSILVVSSFICLWAIISGCIASRRYEKARGYFEVYDPEEEIKFCHTKFGRIGYRLDYCSWTGVAFGFAIVATVAVFICGLLALIIQVNKEVEYQQTYAEYILLSSKLEEDKNNYILFYDDIVSYNSGVIKDKYWADNPWVNWYHNDKVAELPLIGTEYAPIIKMENN